MVSASSDKPTVQFDRMAFKEELKRSLLLDINCQVDDTPECKTADGYKAHLRNLNKRLKSNGRDAILTARIIGQSLTDLQKIYCGNKKLLICATKDLFAISYVYFFIKLYDLATTYYRISGISLPLRTVVTKFKLIKQIACEDEDFWMNGYQ